MKNSFIIILVAIAAIMVALAAFYSTSERVTAQNSADSSSLDRAEVENIIRDFIKNNPEVIVESLEAYQRELWAKELKRRADAVVKSLDKLADDPDSPVAGNPQGDVTVVEFFDYNCGYCKRMVSNIAALLKEDKNVKVVFKEFPILTSNLPTDYSKIAAKASLAVYRIAPEKYFEFHQAIMNFPSRPTEEALLGLATSLKIDSAALKKEMQNPEIEAEIAEVRQLAEDLGISGTPALIINGDLTPGAISLDQLKSKVAAARANAAGKGDADDSGDDGATAGEPDESEAKGE